MHITSMLSSITAFAYLTDITPTGLQKISPLGRQRETESRPKKIWLSVPCCQSYDLSVAAERPKMATRKTSQPKKYNISDRPVQNSFTPIMTNTPPTLRTARRGAHNRRHPMLGQRPIWQSRPRLQVQAEPHQPPSRQLKTPGCTYGGESTTVTTHR